MPLDAVSRPTSLAHAAPASAAAPPPPPPPPPPPAETPTARVPLSATTARFLAAKKPPTPHEQIQKLGKELQARGASIDGKLLEQALGWVKEIRLGKPRDQALGEYIADTRTILINRDVGLPTPGQLVTRDDLRANLMVMHELAHAYIDGVLTQGQPAELAALIKIERERMEAVVLREEQSSTVLRTASSQSDRTKEALRRVDEGITHYVEHRILAGMVRQGELARAQQIKEPARAALARQQAEAHYQQALAAPVLPLDLAAEHRYEISEAMRHAGDQILRTP